jgi:metal-responsive CopG/Arc/MetJ family transcriptional regulator
MRKVKYVRLSITLPEKIVKRVDRICRKEYMSRSAFIRKCIVTYLDLLEESLNR